MATVVMYQLVPLCSFGAGATAVLKRNVGSCYKPVLIPQESDSTCRISEETKSAQISFTRILQIDGARRNYRSIPFV